MSQILSGFLDLIRRPEQDRDDAENCELENSSLIPDIPDDLGLQCLVRVPRRYHPVLAAISRQWKETLGSTLFCNLRNDMGLSEGWLYALTRDSSDVLHWHVLDPAERKWKELPAMPGDALKRYGMACEVLGRELFIVGGAERFKPPIAQVLKYDPITNVWKEAVSLETPRDYFASAVCDGKLYAVGGIGTALESLNSYEVYDPKTQRWSTYDDANIVPDLGEVLVLDGMLYTRHVFSNLLPPTYSSVFDPAKRKWEAVHNDMTKSWCGPTAVTVNGDVFMLDQTFGLKILKLKQGTHEWIPVGRFSPRAIQPPCKMVVIKNNLYIVGRGLKTIVYNLDRRENGGGMLVASSIPALENSEDVLLSCHVIKV